MSKRLPLERVSEQVGKNLISVLIQELNEVKHPTIENHSVWSAMPENMQERALDRMHRSIRSALEKGYTAIFSIDTPAVPAELMKVVFQAGKVQATIEIPTSSEHRHELSDFTGKHVIIVMPNDLDEYFEGMDDIVAEADQAELDLDEPDANFEDEPQRKPGEIYETEDGREYVFIGTLPANEVPYPRSWADDAKANCSKCESTRGAFYSAEYDSWERCPCFESESKIVSTDLTDEERRAANLPDPDCVECGGTGEVMRDIEGDSEQPVLCPICME